MPLENFPILYHSNFVCTNKMIYLWWRNPRIPGHHSRIFWANLFDFYSWNLDAGQHLRTSKRCRSWRCAFSFLHLKLNKIFFIFRFLKNRKKLIFYSIRAYETRQYPMRFVPPHLESHHQPHRLPNDKIKLKIKIKFADPGFDVRWAIF